MEFSIYIWQVEPMPSDPLYHKLRVESDFQVAIDRSQVDFFIEKIQRVNEEISLRVQCLQLPKGQPHSCDNPKETWGIPRKNYKSLLVTNNDSNSSKSWVETNGSELVLNLQKNDLRNLVETINKAKTARVFFEYNYFIEVPSKDDNLVKLNFWGWCENGNIEYAN